METRAVQFERVKTLFHYEDDQALAQVAQNGDGISISGGSKKPTGDCPGQCLSRMLDQMTSRDPFQAQLFCDSEQLFTIGNGGIIY